MKTDILFLNSNRCSILILLALGAAFLPPIVRGQDAAVLNKTSLGHDQNDVRDYANSLAPGPEHYGKGEKKQQINAKELKSKSVKDSTFGGSLLNTGIIGSEPKFDEQAHSVPVARDTKTTKEPAATSDKQPTDPAQSAATESEFTLSETAALRLGLEEADGAQHQVAPDAHSSGTSEKVKSDDQKKDQATSTTSSSTTEEKSSAGSSEKTPPAKPDGDH